MKNKRKMTPALRRELWNLLTWVGSFRDPKIRIEGGSNSDSTHECVLINDHVDFMYSFELDNLREIKGLSNICCLWANKGKDAIRDFDGKPIFYCDLNDGDPDVDFLKLKSW